MNSKNRAILFFSLVALFLLAAPTLVLYSQGYRVDWPPQNGVKLIVKTGGLFVKVAPKLADVYINGNLSKKTDFFFGSCLVKNLLPRGYEISVKKDGYQSWTKKLSIQEKQVTEIKRIILFPQTVSLSALEKNVSAFWPSPDKKKIAILQPTDLGWKLDLYDIGQNVKSQILVESDLSKSNAPIQKLEWAGNSLSIVLTTMESQQTKYYSINMQNLALTPAPSMPAANDSPTDSLATAASGITTYYIDQSGAVFKKDPLQTAAKLSSSPLPIAANAAYKLWAYDQFIFASINSDLYELEPGAAKFTKIFQGLASDVILSPDARKIAYSSNSEIWVMYIKNKEDQPQKSASDKALIARLSKKIADLDWFNSDYLIFLAGNSIKTAEIDDRGSINIADITDIPATPAANSPAQPSFKWDPTNKNLFVFDGSTLYQTRVNTD